MSGEVLIRNTKRLPVIDAYPGAGSVYEYLTVYTARGSMPVAVPRSRVGKICESLGMNADEAIEELPTGYTDATRWWTLAFPHDAVDQAARL